MPPLKAQLLLEESLSAYFPEMVFTDSGITVQLHRNTQVAHSTCFSTFCNDIEEKRMRHAAPVFEICK